MTAGRANAKAISRLLALAAFLASPGAAFACTSDEATAKRVQLGERIQSVMMREPERAPALIRGLASQMAAARQDSRELDWTNVCAQYDALLRQAR